MLIEVCDVCKKETEDLIEVPGLRFEKFNLYGGKDNDKFYNTLSLPKDVKVYVQDKTRVICQKCAKEEIINEYKKMYEDTNIEFKVVEEN